MKNMFESKKIGNMVLKNRFVKSGVWEELATDDGYMTDELYNIYEELARGGVGLIITGYAYVTNDIKPNPGMMGIYNDSFIENYKPLVEMIHSYGSKVVMQLSNGASLPLITDRINKVDSGEINILPNELSIEELESLTTSYVEAAIRAKKAGFDGIELHAGHGYFFSQFLNPSINTRSDIYGGNTTNRAKLLTDIISKVKAVNGSDFVVMVKQNSEDFSTNGLSSEESIIVSQLLAKAGADAIDVTGGNETAQIVMDNNLGPARRKIKGNESYFATHAARLSEVVDIPVILTGGNRDLTSLNSLLNTTNISFFAMGRPFISEPDLVNKLQKDNSYKLRCVSCNGCYNTFGKRCVLNIKKDSRC